MSKTSQRYESFAREYVIDLNGTRAAIAAGYSENGAASQASRLLTKVKVQRIVSNLQSKRASRLDITAERLDEEAYNIAFANMGDFVGVDEHGKPIGLDLSKLSPSKWAAVQEIREDTTGGSGDGERKQILRTTLKLGDKLKALEMLNRIKGRFQDNVKVTLNEGLADQVARFRQEKNAPKP
jgi:phage terminase small subunit